MCTSLLPHITVPQSASAGLALAMALSACSPASPAPPAREPVGKLTVGTILTAAPPQDSDTLAIDHLAVVLAAVEFHACAPQPSTASRLGEMLVGEAQAHVPGASNRVGVPVVLDVIEQGDKARITDEIAPPSMDYCRVVAVLAPADEDVVNLGELATEAIDGKTLYAKGRWRASAEQAWAPFEVTTSATRLVELAPKGGRIALSTPGASAFVLVELARAPDYSDGAPPRADALLTRLAGAMRIYGSSPAGTTTKETP